MLESRLQSRLSGRLTVPAPVRIPVVLAFARHAPVRFDEFTQTLTWPLADRGGRWVGLSLPFEGGSRERIAALERLTARERFWAVLATAELADGGIEIRPYGLWGAGQRLLDFDAPPNPDAKPGEDFAGLLARLTRGFGGGRGGPAGFAARRTPTDRLIDRGWVLLLRGAESGRGLSREAFAGDCREMAAAFALAGLAALGRPFDAAAAAADPAEPCLRAAWALVTARRQRARLAWMA